jgi:DNA polymerase III subunit beta
MKGDYDIREISMEFSVESTRLKDALNIVGRIVSGNPAVPVLAGVKIESCQNRLILTGGDIDISIIKEIDLETGGAGEIIETGELVVPVKYFHELIKKMPKDSYIHIKKDNGRIKMTSGEIETTLNCFNEKDYPVIPSPPTEGGVRIKGSLLIEMIKGIQFAVSKSDNRAVLTGVNWLFSANELTLIATNSQRMALRKTPLEISNTGSYILPVKAMAELVNSIDKHQFVQIFPSMNYVIFQCEDLVVYTRLLSGNYPDITKIIPKQFLTEVVVSRSKLLQGLERANLLASQWKHNNVSFSLTNESKIQLKSTASEIGQITEKLTPLEIRGDKTVKVSFDGKFLAEALKSMGEELVSLSFGGSLRPIIIKPYNKKSTIHLISPVRAS